VTVAAACAAVFWIVGRESARGRHDRTFRAVFVAGGVALAVFGLVQRTWRYDPRSIYWSVTLPDVATPFGPYVNRNHFAGAMLLFAGVAAGSAAHALAEGRRAVAGAFAAAGGVVAVALVATMSRGAMVGAGAGALFLAAVAGRSGRLRMLAWILAGGAVVVAALAALGLLHEFAQRLNLSGGGRWKSRFDAQWDALRVFASNPVFGTGAGTFSSALPPFQTAGLGRSFSSAHSDWAQFLMETGLVGAAFAAACFRRFFAVTASATAPHAPSRWLVLGPAAGCLALCVHGLFETNLHMASNALLLAVTLSLAFGASTRDRPLG
jgi:O-antigen ligase